MGKSKVTVTSAFLLISPMWQQSEGILFIEFNSKVDKRGIPDWRAIQ
jgi:hypothetical protein